MSTPSGVTSCDVKATLGLQNHMFYVIPASTSSNDRRALQSVIECTLVA